MSEQDWQEYLNCRDCVPNLQLMEGRQNTSKNATPLKAWIEHKTASEQAAFAKQNYFPENIGLEFQNFMVFFRARKEKLRNELKEVLAMTNIQPSVIIGDWSGRNDEVESV